MHAGGEHEDGSGEENRAIHLYIMHTKTHESFVKDKKNISLVILHNQSKDLFKKE